MALLSLLSYSISMHTSLISSIFQEVSVICSKSLSQCRHFQSIFFQWTLSRLFTDFSSIEQCFLTVYISKTTDSLVFFIVPTNNFHVQFQCCIYYSGTSIFYRIWFYSISDSWEFYSLLIFMFFQTYYFQLFENHLLLPFSNHLEETFLSVSKQYSGSSITSPNFINDTVQKIFCPLATVLLLKLFLAYFDTCSILLWAFNWFIKCIDFFNINSTFSSSILLA